MSEVISGAAIRDQWWQSDPRHEGHPPGQDTEWWAYQGVVQVHSGLFANFFGMERESWFDVPVDHPSSGLRMRFEPEWLAPQAPYEREKRGDEKPRFQTRRSVLKEASQPKPSKSVAAHSMEDRGIGPIRSGAGVCLPGRRNRWAARPRWLYRCTDRWWRRRRRLKRRQRRTSTGCS